MTFSPECKSDCRLGFEVYGIFVGGSGSCGSNRVKVLL